MKKPMPHTVLHPNETQFIDIEPYVTGSLIDIDIVSPSEGPYKQVVGRTAGASLYFYRELDNGSSFESFSRANSFMRMDDFNLYLLQVNSNFELAVFNMTNYPKGDEGIV